MSLTASELPCEGYLLPCEIGIVRVDTVVVKLLGTKVSEVVILE